MESSSVEFSAMPWDETYYPRAMRNLPLEVRLKAIEIARRSLKRVTRRARRFGLPSRRQKNGQRIANDLLRWTKVSCRIFSPAERKGDPHYSGFIRVVGGEAPVRKHLEHLVVARENIRAEFANSVPLRDSRQMLEE
jgi:hypothetical protein